MEFTGTAESMKNVKKFMKVKYLPFTVSDVDKKKLHKNSYIRR